MTVVKIEFDSRIYKHKAILRAVKAFNDFAAITVSKTGQSYAVTLAEPDPEFAPSLADEFANYVLAETVAIQGETK